MSGPQTGRVVALRSDGEVRRCLPAFMLRGTPCGVAALPYEQVTPSGSRRPGPVLRDPGRRRVRMDRHQSSARILARCSN